MAEQTMELEQAKSHLAELVEQAASGDEVTLTRGGEPVAKIVAAAPATREPLEPRQPGSAKGMVVVADDFDETPEDFAEYM